MSSILLPCFSTSPLWSIFKAALAKLANAYERSTDWSASLGADWLWPDSVSASFDNSEDRSMSHARMRAKSRRVSSRGKGFDFVAMDVVVANRYTRPLGARRDTVIAPSNFKAVANVSNSRLGQPRPAHLSLCRPRHDAYPSSSILFPMPAYIVKS